jgi:hypothetical protein
MALGGDRAWRYRCPVRPLTRLLCCSFLAAFAPLASAQTQYRNLDAGRPGRVEDAESAARYTLDLDVAAFQVERLAGGTMRYRAEPKLAYGVLPFTELELRAPIVQITPPSGTGGNSAAGIAGLTVGVLHSFNLETANVPALALATELSLPVGNLAPVRGSFFVKALATKTTQVGRFHMNGGYGTWTIRAPSSATDPCSSLVLRTPGDTTCGTYGGPPIIIDVPCRVIPSVPGRLASVSARMCMPPAPDSSPAPTPTVGDRWFGGIGFDHSFPFRSLLVSGDLFAERLIGLYPIVDWTAELGVRLQLSPVVVASAGVGRHFAGVVRSTSFMIGATYEVATPPLLGR